jgi:hypothetical protein
VLRIAYRPFGRRLRGIGRSGRGFCATSLIATSLIAGTFLCGALGTSASAQQPTFSMAVSKSLTSGSTYDGSSPVTYQIDIANTGTGAIEQIVITESLPSAGNVIDEKTACTGWDNPPGNTKLAAGDTLHCTFSYTPSASDLTEGTCIDNHVDVTGNHSTGGSADAVRTCFTGTSLTYSLDVTKTVPKSSYTDADRDLNYTITVTNTGTGALTGIQINDDLKNSSDTSNLSCTIPDSLASGDDFDCTYTYTVPTGVTACIDNHVEVTADNDASDSADAPEVCYRHHGLTTTKSVDKTVYTDADSELHYTIEVKADDTNTGAIKLTGLTDSLNGGVAVDLTTGGGNLVSACTLDTIQPGDTSICTATYQLRPGDYGTTFCNIAYAYSDETSEVISNEVCSGYVNVPDKITDTTNTFIMHRMGRLLTEEPKQPTLNQRARGAGRSFQFSPTPMGYSINAFASLAAIRAANEAANGKAPGDTFDERFNAWIEMHGSTYNDTVMGTPHSGMFGVLYAGTDWLINNGLMIGFLAQVDVANEMTADSMTGGTGWMAGPYLSAEILPGVVLDLRGAWGQSSNSVTQDIMGTSWSGNFDTTRWLVRGKLSGTYQQDNWILTPSAAVAYIAEHKYAFSVSDGMGGMIAVPADDLALGRVTIGPELAYRSVQGNYISEPYASIRLLWDFTASGGLSLDGFASGGIRGALEGGMRINHIGGWEMDLSAMYDGLGTPGFGAVSVQGSMRVPF